MSGRLRRRVLHGLHSLGMLALALTFLTLLPIAAATPVDPVWIGGIYDAGDQDEVVEMAISLAGTVELCLIVPRPPVLSPTTVWVTRDDVVAAVFAAQAGRSPPRLAPLPS